MTGLRLVLVEDLHGRFHVQNDDVVVATTAEAVYELSRQGIEHIPIHELVSDDISRIEGVHWVDQLEWLGHFDELIAEHAPCAYEPFVEPATLFGYQLKLATDGVRIRTHELISAVTAFPEASAVTLKRDRRDDPKADPMLLYQGQSLSSRLLPLLATRLGLDYSEEVAEPDGGSRDQSTASSSTRAWPSAVRRLREARRIGRRRATFVLVHPLYDLAQFWRRAARLGHRVLVLEADRLVEPRQGGRSVATLEPVSPWHECAAAVTDDRSSLWDWPRSWGGQEAVTVLKPALSHFVAHVVPRLALDSAVLAQSFCEQRVDAVLIPMLTDLPTCMAVAAARQAGIPSIQVDHGDGATKSEIWDLMHLFHLDHEITPSIEMASYFRERAATYVRRTAEVHVGSYRWRAVRKLRESRIGTGHPRDGAPDGTGKDRPILVYAVTALARDSRYLNNAWYPDTWYYRLQMAIIDALAETDQFDVVVKLFPAAEMRGPIGDYALELGRPHVHVSARRFVEWLPWADRVLLDTPSTALYETALAACPMQLIVQSSIVIRPSAERLFGPAIAQFDLIDEAVEIVRNFVEASNPPQITIEPEGMDLFRTVETMSLLNRSNRSPLSFLPMSHGGDHPAHEARKSSTRG